MAAVMVKLARAGSFCFYCRLFYCMLEYNSCTHGLISLRDIKQARRVQRFATLFVFIVACSSVDQKPLKSHYWRERKAKFIIASGSEAPNCKRVCNESFTLLISDRMWLLSSTKPLGWAGISKCEGNIDQRGKIDVSLVEAAVIILWMRWWLYVVLLLKGKLARSAGTLINLIKS